MHQINTSTSHNSITDFPLKNNEEVENDSRVNIMQAHVQEAVWFGLVVFMMKMKLPTHLRLIYSKPLPRK